MVLERVVLWGGGEKGGGRKGHFGNQLVVGLLTDWRDKQPIAGQDQSEKPGELIGR